MGTNERGISEPFSLTGRRVLVSGASRGIGAAIAVACARAGADVALLARSGDALDDVAGCVRKAGGRALPIACDVRDGEQVGAAVRQVIDELGDIDVLVNNAGGPVFQAPFLEVREAGWDKVLDLNLNSVMRLSQLCGRHMVERGTGSVINIASVYPGRVWPAIIPYSTAKAAVVHLSQALAVAWGDAGVRVNAVCPGWFRTAVNDAYLQDRDTASQTVDAVPLGRWGEPEELADVVVWLASDAARYVTGAVIPVDGGLAVGLSRRWQAAMQLD